MAITSLDTYIAAAKQRVQYVKTASRTTVATFPFSLFDLAGQPGAGTLAVGNTTAGIVPNASIAGFPALNAFGASASGYLSRVEFGNTVPGWFQVFDNVFAAGAFAFNAAVTLASPPSFAARIPTGGYNALQIWVEQVTAATGNQAVSVGYTNQDGTAGRSTGAVGIGAAPTVGRMWQLPLQSGDSGLQSIQSVTGTVATVGTFNVRVMRPLWSGRVQVANGGEVHDLLRTGMPIMFATSALFVAFYPDSTSTGIPEMTLEVANG